LLKDVERTATVISITEVHLLVLGVKDFRRLIEENAQIRETITRVAESRLASYS
jgi:CRP-like cAMP-binding protein